jgi:hypothetical protein
MAVQSLLAVYLPWPEFVKRAEELDLILYDEPGRLIKDVLAKLAADRMPKMHQRDLVEAVQWYCERVEGKDETYVHLDYPAWRAKAWVDLLSHLSFDLDLRRSVVETALSDAHDDSVENEIRTSILVSLAPWSPPTEQHNMWGEVLELAREFYDQSSNELPRPVLLATIARGLSQFNSESNRSLVDLWQETLHILAAKGRSALMTDLAALAPWLASMGDTSALNSLEGIGPAVAAVGQSWR